jgi:hypothetical protein
VRKRRSDKRRRLVVVEELLEIVEAIHHLARRGRDEDCIPRPSSADPVLRAAKFARLLAAAPPPAEQDVMNFADQT